MSRRLTLPDPTVVIAAPGPVPSGFTPGTIPYANSEGKLTEASGLNYDPGGGLLADEGLSVGGGTFQVTSIGDVQLTSRITYYGSQDTEGLGVPAILDDVALTAQNASIVSTNFANAGNVGTYRISFYLVCSTADLTAGTIRMDVTFNDGVAARTLTGVAVALTSTANKTTKFTNTDIDGSLIKLGSGSIAYSTTLIGVAGTSQYALYATLERLS